MEQTVGQPEERTAEIWAVGGGKGGTGKTFVICQLAIHLAGKGKRVILVDTDFGGANVHSFFGLKRTPKNLNNFFDKKEPLENIIYDSGVPNLGIIPGDFHSISSGSLQYARKLKLFKHIKHLDADYVLLDLGGGTGNDTIDAFLLADRMLVVAVPEITAIENLFQFIKNAFFRKLKFVLGDYGLRDTVRDVWMNRKEHGIKTIVDLIEHIRKSSDRVGSILDKELNGFSIYIVLNKVRNGMEIQEGFSVRSICIKYIGVDTFYAGYIEYDFQFWKNLSLIQTTPRLIVPYNIKKDVMRIAENILTGEQLKITTIKNA